MFVYTLEYSDLYRRDEFFKYGWLGSTFPEKEVALDRLVD